MSKDPYKYFRVEARELVEQLSQGVLELEKEPPPNDVIPRLLRLSHTLKGAARVVKQREIADAAHAIEDVLAPLRETISCAPQDRVDAVLKLIDEISSRVSALAPAPESQTSSPTRLPPEDHLRTVRADVAEMDALLNGLAEAHLQLATIRQNVHSLDHAQRVADLLAHQLSRRSNVIPNSSDGRAYTKAQSLLDELRSLVAACGRSLAGGVDRIDRELRQLRDGTAQLRLIPASVVFGSLERAARDAARTVGLRVVFESKGGEVRLDAQVLQVIQGALVQIVLNSVAHGIENESVRQMAGKPPEGRLEVRVERRGDRVAFVCKDDGRGVDVESVRAAALRKGLLSSETQTLSPGDLMRLLLKGGFSTSGVVTGVSGRGIGLDVVREAAQRLGGNVVVDSAAGKGTVVEVIVPVSLSSLEALIVEASDASGAIPLESVLGTLRIGSSDAVRMPEAERVLYENKLIPLIPLERLLGRGGRGGGPAVRVRSAVVIQADAGIGAVAVDKLLGIATVVFRSLPNLALADPIVAGFCLDAAGDPQPVLDTEALVARAYRPEENPRVDPLTRRRVLVVDDSLTSRMLEQSILEGAGYEVDVATSGEEGLKMASQEAYGLFLVDVEMPGMDGFTFIERTVRDPMLHEVPAILLTSRDSSADRKRGEDAGARAFIVKGEFDQSVLLETIRRLIG